MSFLLQTTFTTTVGLTGDERRGLRSTLVDPHCHFHYGAFVRGGDGDRGRS